ncbi:hypothetical protein HK099_001656, partial [Clydaea vesicula]
LEDSNSTETKNFIEKQNLISSELLNKGENREKIEKVLKEYSKYEKMSVPYVKKGEYYYSYYQTGTEERMSLVRQKDIKSAEVEYYFDLNEKSEKESKEISLNTFKFSKFGKYFAYLMVYNGSDFGNIYVADLETPEVIIDTIENVGHTAIIWTVDEKGFFYSRYSNMKRTGGTANEEGIETSKQGDRQFYYHVVGTSADDDILIHTVKRPHDFDLTLTYDGNYLLLTEFNIDYYKVQGKIIKLNDLLKKKGDGKLFVNEKPVFKVLPREFDYDLHFLLNIDSVFYFKTTTESPRSKIVSYDFNSDATHYTEVIPEDAEGYQLKEVDSSDDFIVLNYIKDMKDSFRFFTLPDFKQFYPKNSLSIKGEVLSTNLIRETNEFFFKTSNTLFPWANFVINLNEKENVSQLLIREAKLTGHDSSEYEMLQVKYKSRDGTLIPLTISKRKDVPLDGNNPVYLYGYGGFNVALPDSFNVTALTFMKHYRGIYATAHIRGGAELGQSWYEAGRLDKKENCFDDFEGAAAYLIEEKYTNKEKIAIAGGSNGGLLTLACANRRPDLFKVVISAVPVTDLLRFHKFSCGAGWICDYGSSEVKEQFEYQIRWSPLHNIKKKDIPHPATIVLTGDHDDRVVPAHS